MDTVYTLSLKGQRECAAKRPTLLRELHQLLRMVDGRRSRSALLAAVGKNAITMGGLRWLQAAGYIQPRPDATALEAGRPTTVASAPADLLASVPQDLSSRAALLSRGGEWPRCESLPDFMLGAIERHLGDSGAPFRHRIEHAASVPELLPLLNPVLEAILARAGRGPATEFADAAARLLQPLERGRP